MRRGFSLMEVMIAVLVLAVAISGVLGSIMNLDHMRRDGEDVQRAHRVADFITQALQGTNWDDLNDTTKKGAYLSWARLPDADGSGTIDDDAICLTDLPGAAMAPDGADAGLTMTLATRRRLPFASGLDDLRVYLEYYRAVTATDDNGAMLSEGARLCYAGLLQGSLARSLGSDGRETWTIDPTKGDPGKLQKGLTGLSLVERMGTSNRIAPIGIKDVDANGDGVVDAIDPIRLPANTAISALSGVTIGKDDPVAARIIVTWKDRNRTSSVGGPRRQLTVITGLKR